MGTEGRSAWKLERQQYFQEPGNESWKTFSRGDWEGALRLIEQRRQALMVLEREAKEHRSEMFRVRVVEKPLTPYLQWELNSLRLRTECGGHIRVVGPEHISGLEEDGPLPELVALGGQTFYEIVYDDRGILDGAVRFVHPEITARWEQFIQCLYEEGEELSTYFEREVAPLPPPRPE
jgi:hypothetical protein